MTTELKTTNYENVKLYILHDLSFVNIVPTPNIKIIRKGAHLNFAMGAILHR